MTEQWIIAIGTGILAFIALFQDFFRSWLKTPKLDISTGSFYPICKKLLFEDKDNPNNIAEGYALRIVVKNTKPFFPSTMSCRAGRGLCCKAFKERKRWDVSYNSRI
jgi:hypothetical protein